MNRCAVLIAVFVALALLFIYRVPKRNFRSQNTPVTKDVRTFNDLTDGEKLDYIVKAYFSAPEANTDDERIKKENEYIASLPVGEDCPDMFEDCPIWAKNNECSANPEFMMYNCKKSCKSCAMNPEQLFKYTEIYNNRDSESCIYRGEPYPDPTLQYIQKYK